MINYICAVCGGVGEVSIGEYYIACAFCNGNGLTNGEHIGFIIEFLAEPDNAKGLIITTGVRITHLPTGLVATCKHKSTTECNLLTAKAMIEAGLKL